jgi:SepF-like predicted cell division protein (DUF552 family)
MKVMKGTSFILESSDTFPKYPKYQMVITTTGSSQISEIKQFVYEGGGVVIGDVSRIEEQNPDMYDWLYQLGILFPECNVLVGKPSSGHINIHSTGIDNLKYRFRELVSRYVEIVEKSEPIDIPTYDKLVVTLRYNIIGCPRKSDEVMERLARVVMDFSNKINSVDDDHRICPDMIQGITMVLLCEILPRLPAEFFRDSNWSSFFPGDCGRCALQTYHIAYDFSEFEWASTGIYLPAGVVATVTRHDKTNQRIVIAVGAHADCLLIRRGPWKRWPVSTLQYEMLTESMTIASPFGGPIFLIPDFDEVEMPVTIELEFRGVTVYPQWDVLDPKVWEISKISTAPWGEIQTDFATFTISVDVIADLSDSELEMIVKTLDRLFECVSNLLSNPSVRQCRFIFDVEMANDRFTSRYPIFLPIEIAFSVFDPGICKNGQPNSDLFSVCELYAAQIVPAGGFGSQNNMAISSLAAAHAFRTVYPGSDPLQFVSPGFHIETSVFMKLWKL